jgi:BirA family biotin operon repressor/biotin-[acetyl-CoA-carboxylase] ligase
LIEAASQGGQSYAVIGVGLNVQLPPSNDLRTPPAAIAEFWEGASAPLVLERVAKPLLDTLRNFEIHGFEPLQQRFHTRDALHGLEVGTSDGIIGLCQGVDDQGALQVMTAEGRKAISSSEVSVRPQ